MTRILRLPRGVFAALLAVAMIGALQLSAGARPALALSNCTVSDLSFDAQEQQFLGLINNYRAQYGAGPLTASVNLNRSASWLAVDLGTKDYFSHTDSLGRSPGTRSIACGGSSSVGENIAAGTVTDTAQEAFDMWQASSGHNQNMLSSSYKQIGIARYYNASSTYSWYWVTDFSTTIDGTDLLVGSGGAGGTGGSGGTTPAPAPTPPPAPVTLAKAQLTSPAPGSRLSNTTVTFRWTTGSGAQEYFLYAGSSYGANNLYGSSEGTSLSQTLSNLPRGSQTIYVRLWTHFASGWQYTDYSFAGPR